jgi:ATP-binding cassette subfamily B protein
LKIRKEVGEKLNRLPLRYFDSNSHGDILSRVSNDIDIISSAIKENVPMFISATVNVIGLIIMMLSINPLITLIPVISSIIGFIYIIIIMSTSNTYFVGQRKAIGKISGYVEEIYQGHKIIKSFRREKSSIDTFRKMNEELNQLTWKAQFYSGILSPGIYFIMNFEYVLICIFGGILAVNGKLSVGKILAFIQYSKDSFDPVLEIADSIGAMQAGVAAAQRVFEILDEPEEIEDIANAEVKNVHEGKVVIENVNFGYKKEVTVINNLSVSVKSGQVVAIVGSTGAGKTTLINLLMRFYELDSGRIMIDDTDITQLKRQDLRKFFGMVLQDTWLFSGTIKENITYGRENASDEEIIAASKAAHAHHFIKTLPDGYNTVLSEDASNISQGQKQLLTIARAILTNPTVLILDEATSNVDTRTEVHIQKAMKELMKGRTSFVIAHRLSTIREADIILVMKDGKIIEQGRHEELMSKKGTYYDLHNSQFSDNNINSAENVCC